MSSCEKNLKDSNMKFYCEYNIMPINAMGFLFTYFQDVHEIIHTDPVMTQFFRDTNFAARTGKSQTSKDLISCCDSKFQICTLPLYRLANIHGSDV